jgi:Transposase DDE domain group 1
VRELDERLGLSELMDRHLSDCRRGKNIQLPLADLLRQSIYSRLAGYEDVNDAARLSQDPTFRLIGSRKIWERGAALTSRLQSFETEVLTELRCCRTPNDAPEAFFLRSNRRIDQNYFRFKASNGLLGAGRFVPLVTILCRTQ